MRRNKLIALAFAIATFATLRLTIGPRHHGHWSHHRCTEQVELAEQ